MPINLNVLQQSIVTGGEVVDPSSGTIKLFHKVGDSDIFNTMSASKYKAGDILQLSIRIIKSDRRQATNVKLIPPGTLMSVFVGAVDESIMLDSFCDWIVKACSSIGVTVKLDTLMESVGELANSGKPALVLPAAPFRKAEELVWNLNDTAQGKAHFTFAETLLEDIPEGVELPFDIQELDYVDGHYIPESMRPLFVASAHVAANGEHLNILATGPSGYGKTSTFEALAKWLGYDFLRVDCAAITDTKSWFGMHEAKDGSTFFVPTRFTEMIRRGHCVVVFDETNRVEAWLTNSLFSILDHARRTIVHNEEIIVGPGVIFGMTMNIGSKYAGTFVTDAALMNRVDATVELGPPPAEIEVELLAQRFNPETRRTTKVTPERVAMMATPNPVDHSTEIVHLLNKLRTLVERDSYDVDVSTRTGIKLSNLLRLGVGLADCCHYVVVNASKQEERKALLDIINLELSKR